MGYPRCTTPASSNSSRDRSTGHAQTSNTSLPWPTPCDTRRRRDIQPHSEGRPGVGERVQPRPCEEPIGQSQGCATGPIIAGSASPRRYQWSHQPTHSTVAIPAPSAQHHRARPQTSSTFPVLPMLPTRMTPSCIRIRLVERCLAEPSDAGAGCVPVADGESQPRPAARRPCPTIARTAAPRQRYLPPR